MVGSPSGPDASRTFRVVHFTDVHVQPKRGALDGLKRALRAVHDLEPKVDAILLGGDIVMNSVSADLERVQQQWDLWDEALAPYRGTPILPCIGNQDCWGWNLKASGCTGKEPLFGKRMAMLRLHMERPYYSRCLGGWRVVVLDSLQQGGKHGFTAKIDAAQLQWLKGTLEEDLETPTVILSHVPFVAGPAEFFSAGVVAPASNDEWRFPGQHLHADSYELVELFRGFPNIRLCLAGHTHCCQKIEYRGIWYVHSAAVCGEWWRGSYQGFDPGFTVIDLEPSGAFRTEFVSYDQPVTS